MHMNVHLVNAYQNGKLQKIAEAIRAKIFDVEELKQIHMHMCSEKYPDTTNLEREMEELESIRADIHTIKGNQSAIRKGLMERLSN